MPKQTGHPDTGDDMTTFPCPVKCYGHTYMAQDEPGKDAIIAALVVGDLSAVRPYLFTGLARTARGRLQQNRAMGEWIARYHRRQAARSLPHHE